MKINEIITGQNELEHGIAENVDTMTPIDIDKAMAMFGRDTVADMLKNKGSNVLFDRDKNGRSWKLVKLPDGTFYVERDYMMEGDSIIFEGRRKAVAGTIVELSGDRLVIEGGMFPMIGPEEPPGEMETDLSTMPHREEMLAISAEIWHLLHEVPDEYDTEDELNYLDDQGRKLGYEPVIGIDPYPFLDINWHHKESNRYFKITPKDLKQDQRFRGTVNETVHNFTIDDIKQLERMDGINDVKRQAIALITKPSKRPITPEKQAWLKNEVMGKKDKMAVVKLMYDLMLGGEGMKVIGSKSGYRRKFDEAADGDRRSFTVRMEFEDGGKVTRVFLAKDKQEALHKAMKWAKNEYDPEQGVEAKIIAEAEYHGRQVKLGKPMSGDVKKYKVYVRDPKTGNIKKVNFGDKGMEIKRDDPARRRNFRKRHGCGTPRASNRLKAAYWSCRMWSRKPVSKILKGK